MSAKRIRFTHPAFLEAAQPVSDQMSNELFCSFKSTMGQTNPDESRGKVLNKLQKSVDFSGSQPEIIDGRDTGRIVLAATGFRKGYEVPELIMLSKSR